jgi:peptidoglycan/LPS O-acetylase OafA/YrhL
MKRPEIKPLTSLRFFASAAIVVLHLNGLLGVSTGSVPLGQGVSMFFVLSGFILTYNYANLRPEGRADYLLIRFARIWPTHILCLIIGFVLLHGIGAPLDRVTGLSR